MVRLDADGQVRICVDLTKLNESVCRKRHQLPAVEQTLAQIAGSQWFSKLDTICGFWQIPLSKEAALLPLFITSFGHYCFNYLPFGITSAPEHFQKRMSTILRDHGRSCVAHTCRWHSSLCQGPAGAWWLFVHSHKEVAGGRTYLESHQCELHKS